MSTIPFGNTQTASGNELNEDHIIKEFGLLVKHSEKCKTNQNLRSIISKLEENIKDNEKYIIKMFLLNTKNGNMINSDNAPNISLRVDTMNNIFNSISTSIKNLNIPQQQIDDIFFSAGENCGKSFGKSFKIFLDTYMEGLNLEEKISEWCQFDSSVGWGKLSFDTEQKNISIINNFQAKRNDVTSQPPLDCNFFKGYISGVLSELMGKDIKNGLTCISMENCPKICDCKDCVIKVTY